jgi:hypothetical protein
MVARHASVDTTYTNADFPGHDYRCFGLSQAMGFEYKEVRKKLASGKKRVRVNRGNFFNIKKSKKSDFDEEDK